MPDIVRAIATDKIKPNPYQPRETFDKDKIQELADSFETIGMMQHILVRPHGKGYQIAVGERRWKAAQMAKMKTISCVVRKMDDKTLQLCSVAENMHRENLTSIEQEKAIYQLWTKHYEPVGKSMAQMSRELGKDRSFVTYIVSGYQRRNELDAGDDGVANYRRRCRLKLSKTLLYSYMEPTASSK